MGEAATSEFASRLLSGRPQAGAAPETAEADYSKTLGIVDQAIGSFASDEREYVRWAASQLYPDESVDQAVRRFGKTQDGVLYHTSDDGVAYEVLPSQFPQSLSRIAGGVGKMVPVGAGAAAGVAAAPLIMTGPVGAAGAVMAAGGAQAAGEAARQGIGDVLMGPEVSTGGLNTGEIAYEGATGGLAEGAGAIMGKIGQRGLAMDVDRFDPAAAHGKIATAKEHGFNLTPAEATGMSSLKAEQHRLATTAPHSNAMRDFYEQRSGQVMDAWNQFLDGIAPARDLHAAGLQVKQAAQKFLDDVKEIRSAASSPLYKQAFAEGTTTDPSKALAFVEAELKTAKGPVLAKLRQVESWFYTGVGKDKNLDVSLRGAHGIKMALDEQIENIDRALKSGTPTQAGVGSATLGVLKQVRTRVNKMLEASPAYQAARQAHKDASGPINEYMESAVREIAKVKDSRAATVAARLLSPGQANTPATVKQAKILLRRADPSAWQAVKRAYMQKRIADTLRTAESGEIINVPGKIGKAVGNMADLKNIRAAMSSGEYSKFRELLGVTQAAAWGWDKNSITAFEQEAQRLARNKARPMWAKIMRNVNPAQILRSVDEWATDRNLDRRAAKMVRLITSDDPNVISTMKELARYKAGDWRRMALFGYGLILSGRTAAEFALGE